MRFQENRVHIIADMATASDKIWSKPPKGVKKLAQYALLAPLPVQDSGRGRVIALLDAESEYALQSIEYIVALTGANISAIPVLEMTVAPDMVKLEKQLKSHATKG